jgi:DNA-binding transcriptional ArsR family regulator
MVSDGSLQSPSDRFLKLHIDELHFLLKLIAFKNIEHRDLAVFLAYVSLTEPRSGRCRASALKVAEDLNVTPSTVHRSLKRLREANLIVRHLDKRTGERVLLINPYLLSAGSPQQRGLLIKNYSEAIEANNPKPEADHS